MISQTVEYALRAVVALAYRYPAPMTVRDIAEQTRVPSPYLSKLMQRLVRHQMVDSKRGLGGGYSLILSPEEINVWDVISAVDPMKRIVGCPLKIEGHEALCPLHKQIDDSIAYLEKTFSGTTLAALVDSANNVPPLCRPNSGVPVVQLNLS